MNLKNQKHKPKKRSYKDDPRYKRTLERIDLLERKIPSSNRITKHPKVEHWMPTIATPFEVIAGLFFITVILPVIFLYLEKVPWPHIDIPFPEIKLPSINLPRINIDMPNFPAWVESFFYWFNKTLPIWIAIGIAVYELRKKNDKNKR